MAKAYYSTVFAQSADDIWNAIRDFNNYPVWVDGAGESAIEDGKSGDTVGAVRDVLYRGQRIRQRLVALSDPERAQVYEFCGTAPMPVQHYRATLKITPIVDGGRGFVEWWATFDCTAGALRRVAGVFPRCFRRLARFAAAIFGRSQLVGRAAWCQRNGRDFRAHGTIPAVRLCGRRPRWARPTLGNLCSAGLTWIKTSSA